MVVRIRLACVGRRNHPMYKIVVADSHWPRDGKHLEAIGLYSPIAATKEELQTNTKRVLLDIERAKYWVATGAQPTKTVFYLFALAGILPMPPNPVLWQQKAIARYEGISVDELGKPVSKESLEDLQRTTSGQTSNTT
ncbi:37S ribosomal protein S16, mitochondrial [Galdieria sulphuraria]|uniref:30S ribosomal protein S16 (Mitochondria)l n=1 Tax=Galdieria sulphuraria TaxID=130081 RepID=M2W9X8_GALSU|nr:30S ribosomal protein S16 (mitochondria)l [Galdieria sulphuraria]EME32716.1 30S ribosomal protein S16 (mitochondria)l [Galdieria sulphuraria]GJD07916.1 37S ribosomal protein S16, mitochondrial [Galdieria sulphuraria]|eukprot:XP_005709236.1 30S ribosomal protein S16 (mitochondria)l [Galdieria sulphuraria]